MATQNEGRTNLVPMINTPIAFFSLVVLVTESILGLDAAVVGQGKDRTILVISAVSILAMLILIVAFLAYCRPWVLSGQPPPAQVIQQLTPPPHTETTVLLQYFLWGVREYYFRVLADAKLTLPNHVRINVMLILPVARKKSKETALKIKHVDYTGLYSTDEFLEEYAIGVANCGEAWRLLHQRAWASDLPDAKRIEMKDVTSPTVQSRNSVVSSPILCNGVCIAVLNLDSVEDSKTTHVQLPMVQNLLAEGAREIIPLLFPATTDRRDDNGG
jgi:hypothetical protein